MLKIGVIGAGHLGKFHLNNWSEIEGIQLVGFVDTDDANAAQVAQKYGIPRFENAEALIEVSDAVDIVAPTTSHFELCELAIKKGKHVFVEATG
jgi:predicted dehydrogenase